MQLIGTTDYVCSFKACLKYKTCKYSKHKGAVTPDIDVVIDRTKPRIQLYCESADMKAPDVIWKPR